MTYYVYVILCKDGSFYTGYTRNVDRRMRLHTSGRGARYTRMHRPKKLVYVEEFDSRVEAMRKERKVKTMGHEEKLQLVRSHQKAKK